MCCAQTQSRECVNSGSMWYIVGWVLQTTMYYTTYYHDYTRTVAVTTRPHSSSIAASLHSAAVDPSTRLREAGRCRVAARSVCMWGRPC